MLRSDGPTNQGYSRRGVGTNSPPAPPHMPPHPPLPLPRPQSPASGGAPRGRQGAPKRRAAPWDRGELGRLRGCRGRTGGTGESSWGTGGGSGGAGPAAPSRPQVQLLKDQLAAETAARIEAQARVRQLLLTNRDLLQHVSLLVRQLKALESRAQRRQPGERARGAGTGHRQPRGRPRLLTAPRLSASAVDRSLQNLSLAQSLSLNLKNHYSLDFALPSTSTPASVLGSPVAPRSPSALGAGDSYLNLVGLEGAGPCFGSKDGAEGPAGHEGLSRRVEGSEVSDLALLSGSGRQKAEDADRGDEDRWGSAADAAAEAGRPAPVSANPKRSTVPANV